MSTYEVAAIIRLYFKLQYVTHVV